MATTFRPVADLYLLSSFVQRVLRSGGYGDVHTLFGQRDSDCLAYALASAGYQSSLACQFEIHVSLTPVLNA